MLLQLYYELDPLIPGIATFVVTATAFPYAAARKKIWRYSFLNGIWGVFIAVWVLLFAAAAWYAIAFLSLRGSGIDRTHAAPLEGILSFTLVVSWLIAMLTFALDRHILFASRARSLADLNAEFQSQFIGGKQEILILCEKHTRNARTSVLYFCNSMSFLEHDSKDKADAPSILKKAIAKEPTNQREHAFRKLASDLNIDVRSFTHDPDIRGRLIDRETPDRTRLIVVNKEVDRMGDLIYSARVYSRKDGSFIINLASALFDSLWTEK